MAQADARKMLIVIRRSPYGSGLARAALDVALAAAAFDQPVSLLFMGDGVLQLASGQETGELGIKNLGRMLASLPLYDIEQVYVDAEAAARYLLELAAVPIVTVPLDRSGMRRLIREHDNVLGM